MDINVPRKDRGYYYPISKGPGYAASGVDEYTRSKALAKLLEPEWAWMRPDVAVVLGLLEDDGSLG